MRAIVRRLNRLDDRFAPKKPPGVLRIVVSRVGEKANLEEATCTRSMCTDGKLMEIIDLNGFDDGITSEELDRFVGRFPITTRGHY
jgi:hypothetical protein